jgi:prevent-host-death family protein
LAGICLFDNLETRMTTKKSQTKTIGISELKTKALRMIDDIARKGTEYVVTKNGSPVARVVPFSSTQQSLRGSMKGLIVIRGDIVGA